MFGISTSGFDRLGGLRSFRFLEAAERWAAKVEPLVLAQIQGSTPVGRGDTAGDLRDSIKPRRRISAGGLRLEYTASVPYARFVVGGTKAHEIRPRKGRTLYWNDGTSHFARLVHHPGTRPNPFATRAVRPLMPLLTERLAAEVSRSLKG